MAAKRKRQPTADEKRRAERREQSANLMRQLRARRAAEREARMLEPLEAEDIS
jgi:ribosomal protein L4